MDLRPFLIALILGYFPMFLLPSRRAVGIVAGLVALALAVAWVLMLRAQPSFDFIWVVGLIFVASVLGYGVITGALMRIVLPLPASNKQRWTRAVIAFVPLALLGFALTMLIRDRL